MFEETFLPNNEVEVENKQLVADFLASKMAIYHFYNARVDTVDSAGKNGEKYTD